MKPKLLDIVVIIILAVVPFLLLPTAGGEKRLQLVQNNKVIPLSFAGATIDLRPYTGRNMTLEIANGKARMVQAECPDKVCIKTGWISRCGEALICVPNRVAVQIECKEDELDAIIR